MKALNTKNLTAALIATFALAGAAQAGTPVGEPNDTPFQGVYGQVEAGGATRAAVQAQLQEARAAGLVAFGDSDNQPFMAQAASGLTRMQVAAEVARQPGATAFGEPDNMPFEG